MTVLIMIKFENEFGVKRKSGDLLDCNLTVYSSSCLFQALFLNSSATPYLVTWLIVSLILLCGNRGTEFSLRSKP